MTLATKIYCSRLYMHQIWALEFLDLRFERNYYFMQLLHNVLHIKNVCKGNRNSFFIWNFVTFFLFSIL
jgi:hypothetical protein